LLKELVDTLYERNILEKDELTLLIRSGEGDDEVLRLICEAALQTKLRIYGKGIFLRALIEFTNHCKNSCRYCGIRKENRKVRRYRLSPEQILNCSRNAWENGYRTVVLQGGEDVWFTTPRIVDLIGRIKEACPGMAVTLSIGERSGEEYAEFFAAGVDRFLLRHETTSESVYRRMHPGMSFSNRFRCLKDLKAIGFQTGAGFIVGLDEETPSRLADELLFLKALDADMVGIGPLVPHPDTPLAGYEKGSIRTTLLMIALTRLLLPDTLLPVSTAFNTLTTNGWQMGFDAGANVLMPVLTPADERKAYEIYKDKQNVDSMELNRIYERIQQTGSEVDPGRGDRKYFTGVRT